MSIDCFEPVKQVTTALLAKSSLCPVRRIVDSNILVSFKCDVCSTTYNYQGPATPSPTQAAMASGNTITYVLCSKLYSATKALPFSFSHFSSNTSILCEHLTLASPASAGRRETCVSTVSDGRDSPLDLDGRVGIARLAILKRQNIRFLNHSRINIHGPANGFIFLPSITTCHNGW